MSQAQNRRPKPTAADSKKVRGGKGREEDRPQTSEEPAAPPAPVVPLQGSGKFVFANGSVYAGEWQVIEDVKKRHGYGRLQFGKELYIGDWKDDTMHGKGRFEFGSGCVYEGEWDAGRFHGVGTYTWPSGARYSGEWNNNKMHGNGVLITSEKLKYQGRFYNDYFVNSQGEWIAPQVGGSTCTATSTSTSTSSGAATNNSSGSSSSANNAVDSGATRGVRVARPGAAGAADNTVIGVK